MSELVFTWQSLGQAHVAYRMVDSDSIPEVDIAVKTVQKVLELETKVHPIRRFVITEKAPTRAFYWLKEATTAFTFRTLLRHYANWVLTRPHGK